MVQVFKVRMADGAAARTNGVDIWIDDRLNPAEEKCAVEHELVHIERGEGTCQPEYVEMDVRYETAARLLPISGLGGCRGNTLTEVAEGLGVTRRVLMDRAATLTQAQAQTAGCYDCQLCPIQKHRMRGLVEAVTGALPKILGRVAIAC